VIDWYDAAQKARVGTIMKSDNRTGFERLLLALVPPLIAFILQLIFWSYLRPYAWVLLYPAVFFSSWIGGRYGGLLATVVSVGLAWFFFIPPQYSFTLEDPSSGFSIVLFASMGLAFSYFHGRLRSVNRLAMSALSAATGAREELEARVRSRTQELARSNESLRATETLLRTVTDSAGVGLVLVSPDRRYLFANAAYSEMLGLGTQDIVGQRLADVLSDVYDDQIRPQLDRAFAGERLSYELRRPPRAGEGRERFYAVTYELRSSDRGEAHVVVVIYDITERKRAEEVNAKLAAIVESSDDAIISMTLEGTITSWNRGAERLFGHSAQDAVGRPIAMLTSPERLMEETRMLGRVCDGEHVSHHETVRLRRDGSPVEVSLSVSPILDQEGRVIGASKIFHDITQRKRAEQALRESEERLRLAQQVARVGTLEWNIQTGVNRWTPELEALHGLAPGEFAGTQQVWESLVHPEDRAEALRRLSQALDSGGLEGEWRVVWPDGSIHWLAGRAWVFKDESGKPLRLIGVNIDITERKRAEEAQMRSQKLEALGTLAGGIAHDFNNILAAIAGNTRLAQGDLPADHPAQESLTEIARASLRASDLVRRILAFTHRQETKREVVALQPVVEEALKLLRSTLPAMIEIKATFAVGVPTVAVDSTQIHQVIMNLATNSAHAIGGAGGLIEVALDGATVTDEQAQESSGLRPGRYARMSVSDSGCGMDQDTLLRIFDPFFTTKPLGQGTGLGLSVVHGIVHSHGGAVTVYSQPGRGTAFRLYFPAAFEPQAQHELEQQDIQRGRGERVMYVDDESALVSLTARMLRRIGYEVSGYTSAVEALSAFRSQPQAFDVVVTDLSMPGMSGLELAREVHAVRPDIPIFMTSGYLHPDDQAAALRLGIREVILKPNTVAELSEALHRLFQTRADPPSAPR
jgi:PAS domain S-box-containing protein